VIEHGTQLVCSLCLSKTPVIARQNTRFIQKIFWRLAISALSFAAVLTTWLFFYGVGQAVLKLMASAEAGGQ